MEESFYAEIRNILEAARYSAYRAVNFAMVEAYWQIGRRIADEQGNSDRAEYGARLIEDLAERLTASMAKVLQPPTFAICASFINTFQFVTHCVMN